MRHAATDLDTLKCEQLKNQTQLLVVQNELSVKKSDQLEAVKTTVDDKLTSWASIVKKNSDQPKLTPKELTKVVKSEIQDNDKAYQVMMFNVKEEQENGTSSIQYYSTMRRSLWKSCLVWDV